MLNEDKDISHARAWKLGHDDVFKTIWGVHNISPLRGIQLVLLEGWGWIIIYDLRTSKHLTHSWGMPSSLITKKNWSWWNSHHNKQLPGYSVIRIFVCYYDIWTSPYHNRSRLTNWGYLAYKYLQFVIKCIVSLFLILCLSFFSPFLIKDCENNIK